MMSTMHQIELKARAKINLTLDVLGKRPDGYHDVEMIMQSINLYDHITIRKMRAPGIKLKTNLKWLPEDGKNLAYKAAQLMTETYSIKDGILIELQKRIPVAAGLAGGSSDAAAVFVGLNALFNLNIPKKELMGLGVRLGADIPYCILRGTALARGIGEKLTKLPPMPFCYLVIAKPSINVSTAYIYKNLKLNELSLRPDTKKVIEGIEKGNLNLIAKNLGNVLESVTIKEYPAIDRIKQTMVEYGALGALMSGSGPSVYGIFEEKKQAQAVSKELKLHNKAKDVFVTTIFNRER